MNGQSPIFTKMYDFMLWLLNHTDRYPKSERFRLARRLEDSAFAFHEYLIEAAHSPQKLLALQHADRELDKLRFYLRLAHDRKLLNNDQFHFTSSTMVEIGRLLGGWIKKGG